MRRNILVSDTYFLSSYPDRMMENACFTGMIGCANRRLMRFSVPSAAVIIFIDFVNGQNENQYERGRSYAKDDFSYN